MRWFILHAVWHSLIGWIVMSTSIKCLSVKEKLIVCQFSWYTFYSTNDALLSEEFVYYKLEIAFSVCTYTFNFEQKYITANHKAKVKKLSFSFYCSSQTPKHLAAALNWACCCCQLFLCCGAWIAPQWIVSLRRVTKSASSTKSLLFIVMTYTACQLAQPHWLNHYVNIN